MALRNTTTYVEIGGYLYGCHLTPDDRIRCGACGRGTVALGRCQHCDARVVQDDDDERPERCERRACIRRRKCLSPESCKGEPDAL